MSDIVLDASAVLALLQMEPGADVVAGALRHAAISVVNLSEVVARLADRGMPDADIRASIQRLQLEVVPFDLEQAYDSGLLRPDTKSLGLSLGDRSCLALAQRLALPVLTADRAWMQLSIGVEIRVIR